MIIPNNILSKMDKRDRPRGKAGMTLAELTARQEARTERELHDQVVAWLDRKNIPYVHSRMDRKSTIREGWPDFTVMYWRHVACVELKTEQGVVSIEQKKVIEELRAANIPVRVCRTFAEAITFLKLTLHI
jgi:hypothetical protein